MFHFSPAYFQPYPAYEYSSVSRSPYSGQLLGPRERYMQALAAQEAEEKLRVAEQLRQEELELQQRLRQIREQQAYAHRPSYYHHQPLAFADQLSQLRDFERPSRLDLLRREIEEEERRQKEEEQYRELLRRKQELELRRKEEEEYRELLRRKQELELRCKEEEEYQELLRRKEAIQRAKKASLPQVRDVHSEQPVPAPIRTQTPVGQQVEDEPVKRETREHPIFDGNSLFEAFFGPAFRRPQPDPAATPKATTPKPSDPRLVEVEAIQASFEKLRSAFTFPTNITFNESPADGNPISKLTYAPVNKPIREYEQALMKLIGRLDEISSSGNETLRLKRKQAVLDIEKAIEDLEGKVEARWVEMRAQKVAPVESEPVSAQPAENPEDSVEHSHPAEQEERQTPVTEDSTAPSSITDTSSGADEVMQEPADRTIDDTPSADPSTPTEFSEAVNQSFEAEQTLPQPSIETPTQNLTPELSKDVESDPITLATSEHPPVDNSDMEVNPTESESSKDSSPTDEAPARSLSGEVKDSDWMEVEA